MFLNIIKLIGGLIKPALQVFPLGNALIQSINKVKGEIKRVVTPAGETISGHVKHEWSPIVIEVVCMLILLWAVHSGKIDAIGAIEWLKGL